ncbi:MAG: HD domain-containing protein [Sedimentisphaerales bacterium]|nr:HD domain-containing protein [Sedimentisphaerales bacterium]
MLRTAEENLSCAQLVQLKKFGSRVNKLGANFAFCKADGELVLLCEAGKFKSDTGALMESGRNAAQKTDLNPSGNDEVSASRFVGGSSLLASVLNSGGEIVGTALIDLGEAGSGEANGKCLCQLLELFAEDFQAGAAADEQIEIVGTELAQVYEELVLLHKLSSNMRISESDANYLQIACDSLTEIVFVEGIAILLKKNIAGKEQLVLVAGAGLIDMDKQMMAALYDRLVTEVSSGREALLDSKVDSPFKYRWKENIRNIIVVPLYGKNKAGGRFTQMVENGRSVMGLMVAINKIDKPDFDSTDVKLFNCVANNCAVFIENSRLFADLKGLLIGSLRALTNSIDVKDPYTRGHSERVAFISRWIAERLAENEQLTEEDIHKVYLAGLLHDIGKMGVAESVLRKYGKLSEDEFAQMKTHPGVGAGILGEIEQMRDIVPGVLQHHERCDGSGYPNGLHGDKIALMGKIIGLADSFDAMTSKRTYREAMSIGQALAEIEENLGTQFDEMVGRAFLNSDVEQLWDIMQDGFREIYGSGVATDYGAAAVGALIK